MSQPSTRPVNPPFPPVPFKIWIHRDHGGGGDDIYEREIAREAELDLVLESDWAAFKDRIINGPIKYKEAEEVLWYHHAVADHDVKIEDEADYVLAISSVLRAKNLRMRINISKKPIANSENFQSIVKWQQDQAEMEWMREHDYAQYKRTYY